MTIFMKTSDPDYHILLEDPIFYLLILHKFTQIKDGVCHNEQGLKGHPKYNNI